MGVKVEVGGEPGWFWLVLVGSNMDRRVGVGVFEVVMMGGMVNVNVAGMVEVQTGVFVAVKKRVANASIVNALAVLGVDVGNGLTRVGTMMVLFRSIPPESRKGRRMPARHVTRTVIRNTEFCAFIAVALLLRMDHSINFHRIYRICVTVLFRVSC
jgi:hypothetical protein